MKENTGTIYTIGHSVHSIAHFIALLQSFDIQLLADVRRYPVSKRHPQFNKQELAAALNEAGIKYVHFTDLGGRLDAQSGTYADHMQTDVFRKAIDQLQQLALTHKVAYMCAEADWKHCHRAKISAYLAARAWWVIHITGMAKSEVHRLETVQQGQLFT